MSEESLNAEQIGHLPLTEVQKRNMERDRKFLEEGPPELRDFREELLQKRRDAVAAITLMNRFRVHLERGNPPATELERLQAGLAQAEAEVDRVKEACMEVETRYQAQLEQLELSKYPEHVRLKAKELIQERKKRLHAIQSEVDPGYYGSIGGRIFSYLRSIDKARRENNMQAVERFTAHLEKVKKEEVVMNSKLAEDRKRAEAIQNEFNARLQELL